MPSAASSGAFGGGAGGGGPQVTIPILGEVVNESEISREVYNAFALALGKVLTNKNFSRGMVRTIRAIGREMESAMAKSSKVMADNMAKSFLRVTNAAKRAASSSGSSFGNMVPHTLSAAITRLIDQFNRLETAAKKAATPDVNMERILERLNRQASIATTEGARQQTAALNSALQNQAAATNAAAKQRVAVIQAMSNQIRALERGIGATIKFALSGVAKAAQLLGAALRGIGRSAQAGARAGAAAMRGLVTAVAGVMRGVARLSSGLASGFARGFGAISRALSGALRRDEGALRSSLSRRERMVGASAGRQSSLLSRLTTPAGLAGIAGGAGIGRVLTGGFERFANIERLNFQLERMLGSSTEAAAMIERISNFSRTTSFDLVGVAGLATNFLAIGQSADQTMESISGLADVVAFTGGTTDSLERIQRAMGQIISTGRLQGDELNQLAENLPGINIRKIIADQMGVSTEELVAMQEAGELDADTFINAFLTGIQDPRFEGAAQEIAKTLSGRLANLRETFDIFGASLVGLVADPLRNAMSGVTDVLNNVGAFISGEMFKVPEEIPNPFADMADDAEVLIEDLPQQFQDALAEMGFEGTFVSAADAEQWWEDNMAPPAAVDETMQRLQELRDVLGDFAKGAGGFLAAAGGAKLLFVALRFLISPLTIVTGLFGLLGAFWGRLMDSSVQLRSAMRSLFGGFRLLRSAFGGLLSTVGKLVSNVLFGDGDFFKNLGNFVSDFVLDINLGVRAFTDWVKWVDEVIASGEGFGVILEDIGDHLENFMGNLFGLSQEEIDWAKIGPGNDFVAIFSTFLDKLEEVPILGPIVSFARRIVDTLTDALSGLFGEGFLGDIWGILFGEEKTTGENQLDSISTQLFGSTSDQDSMGTKILDRLEDTFLGPVVRFFRGPFADGVEGAIGGIIGFFQGEGFGNMLTNVHDFFAPALEAAGSAIQSAHDIIVPIAEPLIKWVEDIFAMFKDKDFSKLDIGNVVAGAATGMLAGALVGGPVGALAGGVLGAAFGAGLGDALKETIGNIWEKIKPELLTMWAKILGWFADTFKAENLFAYADFILHFFYEAGRRVAGVATSPAFTTALGGIAAAVALIVIAFTLGLGQGLANAIFVWADLISTALENAWESITPDFIPDPLADAISTVLGSDLTGGLVLLGGIGLGATIVTSVISGITAFGPAMLKGVGGLVGAMFGKKADPKTLGIGKTGAFKSLGGAIAGSVIAGILSFEVGRAAGKRGGVGGLLLAMLTGGAMGAALGFSIGGGPGAAVFGVINAAIAGLGYAFGQAGEKADQFDQKVNALVGGLRDLPRDPFGTIREGPAIDFLATDIQAVVLADAADTGEQWGDLLAANLDFDVVAEQIINGVKTADAAVLNFSRNMGEEIAATGEATEEEWADTMAKVTEIVKTAPENMDLKELMENGMLPDEFREGLDAAGISLGDFTDLYNLMNEQVEAGGEAWSDAKIQEEIDKLDPTPINEVSDAVDRINDLLKTDATAHRIADILDAESGNNTELALEGVRTAAEQVEDQMGETQQAIVDALNPPEVPTDLKVDFVNRLEGVEQELLNLGEMEATGEISDLQLEFGETAIKEDIREQVADIIAAGLESGDIETSADAQDVINEIWANTEASNISQGAKDLIRGVLDDVSGDLTSEDVSTLFGILEELTIDEATLTALQAILEAAMSPAIQTAVTNAIDTGAGPGFQAGFSESSATGQAIIASAQTSADLYAAELGPRLQTAITAALAGLGSGGPGGGTAAVGITGAPPDDAGGVGSGLVGSIVTAIEAGAGAVQTAGQALGESFAAGIRGAARSARAAALAAAVVAATGFNRGRDAAHEMGQNLALSFAQGIRSMAFGVALAAAAIAQAAINAAQSVLQTGSPSKVFINIGRDIGRGFMEGIEEMEGDMVGALSQAITDAIDAVEQTAVARAAEVGSAIYQAMFPAQFPGATPTSTVNSAFAAIREQIAAIRLELGGTAAGSIGNALTAAVQDALNAMNGIFLAFREGQADLNEELADAREHARALAEWDAATKKEREELGDRPDPLSFRERDILASGVDTMLTNTFAGQANVEMINESLSAIQAWAQAALESGASVTAVANEVDRYVAELRRQAAAAGLSTAAIDKLIAAMGLSVTQINAWQAAVVSLSAVTVAGQANIQMINEQLEAIRQFGLELIEAGYSAATVQAELIRLRNALVAQLTAFGFNPAQVAALVRAAGLANDQLAAFVLEMQKFAAEAKNAAAAAAAAAKAAADKAAAEELAAQEAAAAARMPVSRPAVETLNVYLPYGDPEAAGLAAANAIAYSSLTSW